MCARSSCCCVYLFLVRLCKLCEELIVWAEGVAGLVNFIQNLIFLFFFISVLETFLYYFPSNILVTKASGTFIAEKCVALQSVNMNTNRKPIVWCESTFSFVFWSCHHCCEHDWRFRNPRSRLPGLLTAQRVYCKLPYSHEREECKWDSHHRE